MAKVELKQPIVNEIKESIDGAQSVVVVKYLGIDVAKDTALRKAFREADVNYKVYKNTMVRRAIEGTEFEGLGDVLEGPNAFAISKTDATAPARIISKFMKDVQALEIKAGVVEGTLYDAEGMKSIAAVPSRDELISKLLGSLQSPITNLARVLNQIAEKGGEGAATAEGGTQDAATDGSGSAEPSVTEPADAAAAAPAKEEAPAEEAKAEETESSETTAEPAVEEETTETTEENKEEA